MIEYSGEDSSKPFLIDYRQHATTADAGTESVERNYAGYSNGACYEFFVHVAVGETANSDGLEKQADAKKIVRHLEKIASSLQWSVKRNVSAGEKTPE